MRHIKFSEIIQSANPSEELGFLFHFFYQAVQAPKMQYWHSNYPHPMIYKGKAIEVSFSHRVVRRRRGKNKTGVRLEILENADYAVKGCFGHVYKTHTIIINQTTLTIEDKKRLMKIQLHGSINTLELLKNEQEMSEQAGHLSIKPATIVEFGTDIYSFMTMKIMPGKELFEVIKAGNVPPF